MFLIRKSFLVVLINEFQTEIPEPSGLAYNSKTNTLFTVWIGNSTVYEIDFTGKILSSIKIDNVIWKELPFQLTAIMYVIDEAYNYVSQYLMDGKKFIPFH